MTELTSVVMPQYQSWPRITCSMLLSFLIVSSCSSSNICKLINQINNIMLYSDRTLNEIVFVFKYKFDIIVIFKMLYSFVYFDELFQGVLFLRRQQAFYLFS